MTAPTLLSDGLLLHALAGPDGVPNDRSRRDPRMEPLEAAGLIALYGDRWRWRSVRIPSQLTREQREVVREDMAHVRGEDR